MKDVLKKLEEHDDRFDQHDKRFDEHDKRFDRIILKLIDHDEQFKDIRENMVTKKDFDVFVRGQDKIITILERLDQERIFTNEAIERLESDMKTQKQKVAEHDRILERIKID